MVYIIVSITAKSPMIKPTLFRTRPGLKRKGLVTQVIVAAKESVLVVANIIKTAVPTKGTSLEWQILPALITMEFSVLIGFGWLIGKCQDYSNVLNAHATGFHYTNLLAGTSFWLPSTHPFHHHHTSTHLSLLEIEHGQNSSKANEVVKW